MMSLAGTIHQIKNQQQQNEAVKTLITSSYPVTVKALRIIDLEQTQPKRRKGFSLVKRESKRHGYLYYVRYYYEGKMLPSKWNTHTNNPDMAERFARDNKARLIDRYLKSRNVQMYAFFEGFYAGNQAAAIGLSTVSQKAYHAIMTNTFVSYLKQTKISNFNQITTATLTDFQDYLLSGGMKPQTVNNKLKVVRKVFAHMARKGMIENNPAERLRRIPVRQTEMGGRGCYELDKLQGVFSRQWEDKASYFLALLIYSTGMRNGEILRLRKEDIAQIDGISFVNVRKSKTFNGIRLVPLHDFVYQKLCAQPAVTADGRYFDFKDAQPFNAANAELARQLGVGPDELKRENITFYSGRHYWKTLMSSEGLGEDIEEIFMGHKVSGNVAKLYNHRDKLGKQRMVDKAKQVFAILDRCLFAQGQSICG